jgi:DNA-binding MarR family transcriptional regulator
MTLNRIQGKFYPLQSEEWLETVKQLTHSELKILYYIRSLDPYNKGISITPIEIAKDLSTEKSKMHRSTVGRALKSLDSKGFIQMELIQVQIKVNPKGFLSQTEIGDVAVTQPSCEQTTQVVTPQPSVPEHNLECSQATFEG